MIDEILRPFRSSTRVLVPTLLQGAVLETTGRLRLTGGAAIFEIHGEVAAGWVEVDIRVGADATAAARARLLAPAADGTSITAGVLLGVEGHGRGVLRLPMQVNSIRLEIENVAQLDMPQVRIRRVSGLEAAAFLAVPLLVRRLREPGDVPRAAAKLLAALRRGGPRAVRDHLLQKQGGRTESLAYAEWGRQFVAVSDVDRAEIRARSAALRTRFSIVMPVYETGEPWLARAIESVRAQLYPHWELCIADDASQSPHVRRVLTEATRADDRIKVAFRQSTGRIAAASNTALHLARGDFIVLLDHDDELTEHALFVLATRAHEADVLYSDEDKIDESGAFYEPFFKPDWNPDLLLSQNYIGHLCAIRRALVEEIGGFREGFEGSQDYDLFLRATARTNRIEHLPYVLYHWRSIPGSTARGASAKPYAEDSAIRALQEHVGSAAHIEKGPLPTTYRVRWRQPRPPPVVSIIIPTRDAQDVLEKCVESIIRKTAYREFELLIVDNQSRVPAALEYFSSLERRGAARVLRFDAPFNFAAINNFAARHARGTILALLNNDLEVTNGDWLDEMVSHALRPEIGAVGARLLYPDGTIQHGGIILGIGGIAGHEHKYAPADAPGYFSRAQLAHDVSAVTAACLLIRKETFDAVGGLDETLAVAFNDVDFCLRVRKRGLRNVWTPFATLLHHESKSRGRDDDTRPKRARFREEAQRMRDRWGEALRDDPAYNPNLTLESEDFSLAWPPRVRMPWRAS
jgi:GT2 family glycosyltransferase